ncbi:MAG TPA: type 1 glutamine amidotransferase [Methanothrix soehngenii]|nr:type 1 glutamine amidotransferase [Methanothrix soehngenii]
MRLHYIQHNPFEDPANIALWAEDSGHDVFGTKIFAGERLPKDADFDLLLVLGGEMNIYQEDLYPWLAEEKRFIRRAMDSEKTILGICLGAQLISDLLGGTVHKNRYREIGWHVVKLNRAAFSSFAFKGFPDRFTAFQWHGDTFDLPGGATGLASTTACANQAFEIGRNVGLQFHLESSWQSIRRLIDNCGDELTPGRFVQEPEDMLSAEKHLKELYKHLGIFMKNIELMVDRD